LPYGPGHFAHRAPAVVTIPRVETVVRGRWIWTGERLLERGGLIIQGDTIAAVLEGSDLDPRGAEVIDLPRALVHHGLLNAHCHLDLSDLGGAIPAGLAFSKWLLAVRDLRRSSGVEGLLAACQAGVKALIESGTTAVVDFSHGGHSETAIRGSGIRAAVLREVIGPTPDRAAEAVAAAGGWMASRIPDPRIAHGLAPHSPYLATGPLIRHCRRLAAGRPFSIHAAELPGETELLRKGTGELRDFLSDLGLDLAAFSAPGLGPLEYLDSLGVVDGSLLVHGNSLEREDIELLRGRRAAVVFCPRSHRYFDRPAHPLPALLEAGIPVALGTDSAASSQVLSVAEEMREVRRSFPGLSARAIWDLGTGRQLPAAGLGLSWEPGLLAPGRAADLAAAELPAAAADPLAAFLEESVPCVLTMVGGRRIW
jgi:aminodeoxyfutalosine deaminase